MKKVFLFFSTLLFGCLCSYATVKLPALISDNMVLQQKAKITLWGWADAGEPVAVWNSWNNRTVKTKADANGNWRIQLQTIHAGGPYEVRIKSSNAIAIKNVLLGEVWLCSGQSNMEFPLGKQQGWRTGVFDYEQAVANANEPLMRLFTVKQEVADTPQSDVTGYWSACTPSTAANFSAVAYYFARKLIHTTGFPVGLIHSSWGGTPAESWTNKEVLQSNADFLPILERYQQTVENYPALLKAYETAVAEKKQTPKKPVDPFKDSKSPCKLYNAMIHPLIPFTLKGVIWYQGESNASRAYQYRKLFPALIRSWRKEWNANLPFYFVQIAPEYQQNPEIREAQLFTYRTVPNTGMAVIADAGDSLNVHPRSKEIVGNRLAACALVKNYGIDTITYASPFYRSMKIEQDKIRIRFDFAEKGLATNDGGAVRELVIAGADKRFIPAIARIEGNSLVVWSPQIKQPIAVRYAWKHFFRVNLFSKEGWPVSPFRTDDWEGETQGKN